MLNLPLNIHVVIVWQQVASNLTTQRFVQNMYGKLQKLSAN